MRIPTTSPRCPTRFRGRAARPGTHRRQADDGAAVPAAAPQLLATNMRSLQCAWCIGQRHALARLPREGNRQRRLFLRCHLLGCARAARRGADRAAAAQRQHDAAGADSASRGVARAAPWARDYLGDIDELHNRSCCWPTCPPRGSSACLPRPGSVQLPARCLAHRLRVPAPARAPAVEQSGCDPSAARQPRRCGPTAL